MLSTNGAVNNVKTCNVIDANRRNCTSSSLSTPRSSIDFERQNYLNLTAFDQQRPSTAPDSFRRTPRSSLQPQKLKMYLGAKRFSLSNVCPTTNTSYILDSFKASKLSAPPITLNSELSNISRASTEKSDIPRVLLISTRKARNEAENEFKTAVARLSVLNAEARRAELMAAAAARKAAEVAQLQSAHAARQRHKDQAAAAAARTASAASARNFEGHLSARSRVRGSQLALLEARRGEVARLRQQRAGQAQARHRWLADLGGRLQARRDQIREGSRLGVRRALAQVAAERTSSASRVYFARVGREEEARRDRVRRAAEAEAKQAVAAERLRAAQDREDEAAAQLLRHLARSHSASPRPAAMEAGPGPVAGRDDGEEALI